MELCNRFLLCLWLRLCSSTSPQRKNFLAVRVVEHWNGLPREVLDVLCLETFKVRLDGALRNLI